MNQTKKKETAEAEELLEGDACEEACEVEQLKNELEVLRKDTMEMENKILYHQAELVNYRKRKEEEVSNLLTYANQDLIFDLIPILDNFERAMNVDHKNEETLKFISGIQMVYQHMKDTLIKFGVTEIEALGLVFDPTCHEAMLTDCDKEKEDDIVLEVLMKGYRLKDRVIRPTVVKVNKLED